METKAIDLQAVLLTNAKIGFGVCCPNCGVPYQRGKGYVSTQDEKFVLVQNETLQCENCEENGLFSLLFLKNGDTIDEMFPLGKRRMCGMVNRHYLKISKIAVPA